MLSLLSALRERFYGGADRENGVADDDGQRPISFAELLAMSSCPDCADLPIDEFRRRNKYNER